MCGIAGIVRGDGRPVDSAALAAMTDAMRHRGPDDRGVFVSGPGGAGGPSVGLGHRRLSILDLSELGRQPMGNEDGSVQAVFNGEIYDFSALRAELEGLGHRFASGADTEVIVHGYEQWGLDVLSRLHGMFAFGLWDAARSRLVLARDRFGKKPLYWHEGGGALYFASELPALLAHPAVPRVLDPLAVADYLQFEYVPAPRAMLSGVGKLPAGHFLVWENGATRTERYWEPRFGGLQDISEAEAEAELERLLSLAVARRLVSDVPLGLFLSGGVDSSALASFMADHLEPSRIRTFSIGFAEASFDESSHARAVARALGTDHSERILREADLMDVVPLALDSLGEPMADSSIVPTYLLSAFTRESVTVALGGDGGDELFAGYDTFLAQRPGAWAERLPGPLLGLAEAAVNLLPASERNMSLDFRLRRFLAGMRAPRAVRHQVWLGSFTAEEQRGLLAPDFLARAGGADPLAPVAAQWDAPGCADDVARMIRFYLSYYMAGHILAKVDTASMARSLEVRTPFLDTELAEFVCKLPSRMKLRGTARKWILRRMLRRRLPPEIVDRPKKGFGIPLAKWLRGGLRPLAEELLSERVLREGGVFRPEAVRALWDAHLRGARDNRKELWTLVCFQHWQRRTGAAPGGEG